MTNSSDTDALDELVFQTFSGKKGDNELVEGENRLMFTKWFDYRFWHPVEATRHYAAKYLQIHREFYLEFVDQHYKPPKWARCLDVFNISYDGENSIIRSLWKGRRIADALCMPYGSYIRRAMRYRGDLWAQIYVPQPKHLYADWIVENVENDWHASRVATIPFAESEYYSADQSDDNPMVAAYRDYLVDCAQRRAHPDRALALMVKSGRLTREQALKRLHAERTRQFDDAAALIEL